MIIGGLLLALPLQGCIVETERNLVLNPEVGSVSAVQLPLSVRLVVQEFKSKERGNERKTVEPIQFNPHQAILSYMNKRQTFRQIVENGPADVTLKVKGTFTLDGLGWVFAYDVALEGVLTAGEETLVGTYAGEGQAKGGSMRLSAESDAVPINQALGQALDKLFAKIEADRQVILAKVGGKSMTVVQSAVVTPSHLSSDELSVLPRVTAKMKKNAYAVVIGIEQYREKLPKADFADRDAKLMGEYLTKVLGYPEENVIVRLNERATRTDLVKYFEDWLRNNVDPGGSVFVYYSGHGAPNSKTGEAYLVPYDGDPAFVESTAYPVKQLYAALEKLPAKDITVVLDSCFSGAGGRSVLAKGARPMVLSLENSVIATGKIVVLAASAGDQISSTYEEKGHGLLTYYFLKGLQGGGDLNKDGVIDIAELYEYVKPNVQKVARKQYNNEQTPQLLASPDLLKKGGGRLVELR
jgi:hypothetical protein